MAAQDLGLEITELRLGLPCMGIGSGINNISVEKNEKKRAFSDTTTSSSSSSVGDGNSSTNHDDDTKSKKNQVVGWPPVCTYRKKNSFNGREISNSKMYVKVSMDGAPILRKIDLTSHKDYSHLIMALDNLFHCFGIIGEALKDAESNEYVPIYEDKDGDWMLVGDVPWEMFTESCKRLRIMKRADAKGIGLHVKSILKRTKNVEE